MSDASRSSHRFIADCPICGQDVTVQYTYDRYAADDVPGRPGGGEAHSPEILAQDCCSCLLGQDFADDALDYYLDRS